MSYRSFSKSDIESLETKHKIHLINSITGIKPANLIATVDSDGLENVAVFSSVVHLGSAPALLGFIMRPSSNEFQHTYNNIKQTGFYTLNAVTKNVIAKAHHSSAKFFKDQSEFEQVGLQSEYMDDFYAPFVKEAPIQIGMKFLQEIPIEVNQTRMIVGSVETLRVLENGMDEKCMLNLSALQMAGIAGLNAYYDLNCIAEFQQAQVDQAPHNILEN
jgi:flavin reductase (DIM6/NTAB) family NADH-FMN oxidoreductase RutF